MGRKRQDREEELENLVRKEQVLPLRARAAIAVVAARRVLPAFDSFVSRHGTGVLGDPATLMAMVNAVWVFAQTGDVLPVVSSLSQRAEQLTEAADELYKSHARYYAHHGVMAMLACCEALKIVADMRCDNRDVQGWALTAAGQSPKEIGRELLDDGLVSAECVKRWNKSLPAACQEEAEKERERYFRDIRLITETAPFEHAVHRLLAFAREDALAFEESLKRTESMMRDGTFGESSVEDV